MNKKQQAQFDRYKKHLGITTRGEEFVLRVILGRDWNRDIILLSIEEIKLTHKLIGVKCRTRSGSYWFSVSDIEGDGWREGMSDYEKESYVRGDLYHKIRH